MKTVILYTTKTCPKCQAVKDWLNKNNGSFEERDLENVMIKPRI